MRNRYQSLPLSGMLGELFAEGASMRRTLRPLLVSMMAVSAVGCTVGFHGWVVRPELSQASGTRSCTVTQFPLDVVLVRSEGRDRFSGGVYVLEEVYPGRPIYLSVDGQRFEGTGKIGSEAIEALKLGREGYISWAPLYYGGRREEKIYLRGFLESYKLCEEFVGGKLERHD